MTRDTAALVRSLIERQAFAVLTSTTRAAQQEEARRW